MLISLSVAMEPRDILKTIKSLDDVYEASCFSTGNRKSVTPRYVDQTKKQKADYDWQYTQEGHRRALLEISRISTPMDDSDSILFHRQVYLFDEKRSGKKLTSLLPEVPVQQYLSSQKKTQT